MPPVLSVNFLDSNFRSNPECDLVLFERLKPSQKKMLQDLQIDANFYGVLVAKDESNLVSKAIDRDTALLYFTLQKPGVLPQYVKEMPNRQITEDIARLVLDGILEIELNGKFISGFEAYNLIYEFTHSDSSGGLIAQLSLAALKYAQQLQMDDALALAARLYFYNRRPISPYWKKKFPNPEAVANHLGIRNNEETKLVLKKFWVTVPENKGWFKWRLRHKETPLKRGEKVYKLYISPNYECLNEVFQICLESLPLYSPTTFKVSQNVYGLLRPDKMVAYFNSLEDLMEASNCLHPRLTTYSAQGVPFTAEISRNGLLSWGIDPPADQKSVMSPLNESWRVWITHRLALTLVSASKNALRTVEPWRFALERLQLDGIDTETWMPNEALWNKI
jgi:hypothetical protein